VSFNQFRNSLSEAVNAVGLHPTIHVNKSGVKAKFGNLAFIEVSEKHNKIRVWGHNSGQKFFEIGELNAAVESVRSDLNVVHDNIGKMLGKV
jgi:hypothetical protein